MPYNGSLGNEGANQHQPSGLQGREPPFPRATAPESARNPRASPKDSAEPGVARATTDTQSVTSLCMRSGCARPRLAPSSDRSAYFSLEQCPRDALELRHGWEAAFQPTCNGSPRLEEITATGRIAWVALRTSQAFRKDATTSPKDVTAWPAAIQILSATAARARRAKMSQTLAPKPGRSR